MAKDEYSPNKKTNKENVEADDEPTHILFASLDVMICPLCGKEFKSGVMVDYGNGRSSRIICDDCDRGN